MTNIRAINAFSGLPILRDPTLAHPFMHVQYQEPSGTISQEVITAPTVERFLNTILTNKISGSSLSQNLVTLPAGEYFVEGSGVSRRTNATTNAQTLLKDSSDNILLVSPNIGNAGSSPISVDLRPVVSGRISLTATTQVKLVTYSNDVTTAGTAVGSGANEVYTELKIWQIDAVQTNPMVYQPLNQPITGAYTTGNIFGGELVYISDSQFSVNPISCMSDDLTTELVIDSTTTQTISVPTINTIYNVFVVRYTGGTFGVEMDTDINGATLPGIVTHKRWLGFVRTNAGGDISAFHMIGDQLIFETNADQIVVPASMSTSW
ncbi:MAG: hypothetical protein KAS32_09915, partial [Candidatus Peribacteraceae bacterium]|nr:hypothetical protein [Candidatus Peribacteraceae bacterium]